jgi:hypothetical protein
MVEFLTWNGPSTSNSVQPALREEVGTSNYGSPKMVSAPLGMPVFIPLENLTALPSPLIHMEEMSVS